MQYLAGGETNMSPKSLPISAIILAKNEAQRIDKCIDALSFCREIIVVDNGSRDDTGTVSAKHGASVIEEHSPDFAALRNAALGKIKNDWVLYVDADEIVTPALASSIRETVSHWSLSEAVAYRLHRVNYYLGHRWPTSELMLRLFRREALLRWEGKLHETPVVKGRLGSLTGDLSHDTHRTLEEMVAKTNEWSGTEARLRISARHPKVTWWRLLRVMITGFWDSFFRQGGWRAGTVGLIESIYQGFSMFITYAKLWELQEKS